MTEVMIELGWRPSFDEQMSDSDRETTVPVRVMAVHRGKIAVSGAGLNVLISPHICVDGVAQEHPTVGDWVLLDRRSHEPRRVLDRENLFRRPAPGTDRKHQLIAANVDTLFLVASCNEDFSVARLERYLVLAREVNVRPVIVLTKIDLTDAPERFAQAARGLQPDLLVEMVNARDPASVAKLAAWCARGLTVALMGSSGVGKSTLVNTLRGSDSIATQAIRKADGTGRHTTTVREMHRLAQGGWLLDTPGMRALQLSDTASGIAEVFDDFLAAAQQCRFSDCAHQAEPGCGVQAGIAAGTLTTARFERWRNLAAEDRLNSASMAERRALARIAPKAVPFRRGKR
ncbi:ribosome small subunit-dependent GTPase A [Sphingobium sufflavum]|uniref:ribosome small subunit-dependent GTPase A n=1 Tax=Sphingobium sufflavum TaxID=1129547 RepID=UPI001F2BC3EE|nr:ribosome small subunit-dependent GTPase A [Sphingobium sufflavum]MCE7796729.1 ribosome small subunit-dependent GTPase A [Sphingobium sufflavum]